MTKFRFADQDYEVKKGFKVSFPKIQHNKKGIKLVDLLNC